MAREEKREESGHTSWREWGKEEEEEFGQSVVQKCQPGKGKKGCSSPPLSFLPITLYIEKDRKKKEGWLVLSPPCLSPPLHSGGGGGGKGGRQRRRRRPEKWGVKTFMTFAGRGGERGRKGTLKHRKGEILAKVGDGEREKWRGGVGWLDGWVSAVRDSQPPPPPPQAHLWIDSDGRNLSKFSLVSSSPSLSPRFSGATLRRFENCREEGCTTSSGTPRKYCIFLRTHEGNHFSDNFGYASFITENHCN